jgi:hypothetical protein
MFHPYESATYCTDRAQPGTKNLMVAINDLWDQSTSLGIYNCRPVRGGTHLSIHSQGRAVDIGFPVQENEHGFDYAHPDGHRLLRVLLRNAWPLGLQAIIWDRRWYSRTHPTGRTYTGVNPHIDHLHIEQNWFGANGLSLTAAYQNTGEDEMTPEQEETLNELVQIRRNLIAKGSNLSSIEVARELVLIWRKIDDVLDNSEI